MDGLAYIMQLCLGISMELGTGRGGKQAQGMLLEEFACGSCVGMSLRVKGLVEKLACQVTQHDSL